MHEPFSRLLFSGACAFVAFASTTAQAAPPVAQRIGGYELSPCSARGPTRCAGRRYGTSSAFWTSGTAGTTFALTRDLNVTNSTFAIVDHDLYFRVGAEFRSIDISAPQLADSVAAVSVLPAPMSRLAARTPFRSRRCLDPWRRRRAAPWTAGWKEEVARPETRGHRTTPVRPRPRFPEPPPARPRRRHRAARARSPAPGAARSRALFSRAVPSSPARCAAVSATAAGSATDSATLCSSAARARGGARRSRQGGQTWPMMNSGKKSAGTSAARTLARCLKAGSCR